MPIDKYYVYRPLLDLIGYTEGTDEKRGYNETLGYGAYTGGAVNLVGMTLKQIDALQTKMLAHPKNKWKSSALGRYQIVRTTLRTIKKTLGLADTELFDEDMQDRCACYLLGVRGVDKYLAGRMKEDTLIDNLSKEWASLPTTKDKGYYDGQNARVKSARVRQVLAEVGKRHDKGQPKEIVTVDVPKPVVPVAVEKEVKQKTNWLSGWLGLGGVFSGIGTWMAGFNWQTLLVVLVAAVVVVASVLLAGEWIVRRVKSIRSAVED